MDMGGRSAHDSNWYCPNTDCPPLTPEEEKKENLKRAVDAHYNLKKLVEHLEDEASEKELSNTCEYVKKLIRKLEEQIECKNMKRV